MAIITLTTDFGTRDGYVGAMKGVILSLAPLATVVDLTHDVPAQDTAAAAFALATAAPHFPPGTIHLAVVDPGVGTARAPVIVVGRGQCFVGPDNGIFDLVAAGAEVRRIEAAEFVRAHRSHTFHGRDIFAPAAAALARGLPAAAAGPVVELVGRGAGGASATGDRVVHVDRFGNLITSLTPGAVGAGVEVALGGERIGPLRKTYAEVPVGALVAYVGSAGLVEIAVRNGSAAERLGLSRGAPVTLIQRPASGRKKQHR